MRESDPPAESSTDSSPEDLDRYRTDAQKEWAAWAAHGYRKLYQPRSIQRFGLAAAPDMAGAAHRRRR